jgi:hypothetical protein
MSSIGFMQQPAWLEYRLLKGIFLLLQASQVVFEHNES